MTLRRLAIWLVVLCGVQLAALPALAAKKPTPEKKANEHEGVAHYDSRDETVLLGPGAVAAPATLDMQGKWTVTKAAVERQDGGEPTWWLAAAPEARMQDGFVRGRLVIQPDQMPALMVRAHVERKQDGKNELAALSGYGVTWQKGRIDIRRYDGPSGKSLLGGKNLDVKPGTELEILVWMVGPHLHAEVLHGETFAQLATLTVSDATYPEGSCGLRLGQKKPGELRLLSVRAAGKALPSRPGALGPMRYLQVATRQAELCGRLRDCRIVDRGPAQVIAVGPPAAIEALRRQDPGAQELALDEPRAFADPAFRAAALDPVVPEGDGFALYRSYKDPAMLEALLRAYAKKYPQLASLSEVAHTLQGRSVWALRIHAGKKPVDEVPQVLINGAHHGVELAALEFALDACAHLLDGYGKDPEITRWDEELTVWCIPLVNPDGNHAYLHVSRHGGRKNGRDTDGNGRIDPTDGVDLNRNYPYRWHSLGEVASNGDPRRAWYRGARAATEPEVQGMMRLSDAEHFVSSISYHTQANAILVPYTIPEAPDPQPNEAWDIAKLMSERAGRQITGSPLQVKRRLYPVDGVDQDWHRAANSTTAFLVEGSKTNPGMDALKRMVEATRGTWQALLERTVTGPAVRGRTVDAQGRPVVAEVRVREVKLLDGERWISRCRDGRFDRLLPGPGRYTLEAVSLDGQSLGTREITVGAAGSRDAIAELAWQLSAAQPRTSCSRADLCAVDSLCEAEQGRCVTAGPGRWCRIDGHCVGRGQKAQEGQCDPERDPWGWSRG